MGGVFPRSGERTTLALGNSGTSLRLLLAMASLRPGSHHVTGSPRMLQRPVGALFSALRNLGVTVSYDGETGFPPLVLEGSGPRGGRPSVAGDTSSQFVSALILAGACASRDEEIEVCGNLVSRHYEVSADGLAIEGLRPLRPAVVHAHADHRMAMSLAVVGLRVPGLRIQDPDCVGKSFPDFRTRWRMAQDGLSGGP